MIGNPKWFTFRKYGGWGITPKTWQGWAYIAILIAPLIFLKSGNLFMLWLVLVLVELIDIKLKIKKDERERIHDAIAERNASWFMVLSLVIGTFIKMALENRLNDPTIDPVIVVAILGGALVKSVTHWWLRDK